MNTLDAFNLFLDAIKRESTSVVSIPYWNRLMNSSMREWMASKAPTGELVQDRIDDLEMLRVVTDNTFTFKGNVLSNIDPIKPHGLSFYLPKYYGVTGHQLKDYPTYFRLLNVMFVMSYFDDNTGLYRDSEDWEYARILRSDKRAVTPSNFYRRAKEGRLYYEIVGGEIRVYSETDSEARLMRLEYYRYPDQIYLDETSLADHTVEAGIPYTPGYGSIPCELPDVQTEEVIKIAALKYLERNSDSRFQSFAAESNKSN